MTTESLRTTGVPTSEPEVERMFSEARGALVAVDVVVNNAGILTESPVQEMSTAMFDEMISVNLRSVFLCSRAALPPMLEAGFGLTAAWPT